MTLTTILEAWSHPTTFTYIMAAQYLMLALLQVVRGEFMWAGMWASYGIANIFIAGKQ